MMFYKLDSSLIQHRFTSLVLNVPELNELCLKQRSFCITVMYPSIS